MKKFSASSVFQTICSIACCRVEFGFCLRIFRSFSSNKCLLSAAWTFGNWGPARRFVTTGENCHQLWSKQRSSTPLPQYKSEFSPLLGNSCWKSGSGVLLSTDLVILNYFRKYFFLSGQEINLNLHWTWRTQTDWQILWITEIFFTNVKLFFLWFRIKFWWNCIRSWNNNWQDINENIKFFAIFVIFFFGLHKVVHISQARPLHLWWDSMSGTV